MKISYFLIIISLALGLLGVFTDTHKEKGNKKKFTIWAYVVSGLIVFSGIFSLLSEIRSNKEAEESAQQAKAEYDRRNKELNTTLSQQRFISLVSAGSSFSLARNPELSISFVEEQDSAGNDLDSHYNSTFTDFPGLGTMADSLSIDLRISEERYFGFNKRLIDIEPGSTSINSDAPDTLSFYCEQMPHEMLYAFSIPGYKEVLEVLFDFEAGTEIGHLSFYKTNDSLNDHDLERLKKMLLHDRTSIYLHVFIEKKGVKVYQSYIHIPLKASNVYVSESGLTVDLVTEEPRMGSSRFFPY
jgi:hypothetical protein